MADVDPKNLFEWLDPGLDEQGKLSPATGGVVGENNSGASVGGGQGSVDGDGVSNVQFGTQGALYKVVKVASADDCLGMMKGNLTFCKKIKARCDGRKHAGDGVVTMDGDSLGLEKSTSSVLATPLLPLKWIKQDLQTVLLSKKISTSEWSKSCAQLKAMDHPVSSDEFRDYKAHSEKALNYVQTPRKRKFKVESLDSDDDSVESPYEKLNTFEKEDPLNSSTVDVRLDLVEEYLTNSSNESKELATFTGTQVKTLNEGHRFHSTIINELVSVVGAKNPQFPQDFDAPNLWATVEAISQFALLSNADIPAIVSRLLSENKVAFVEDAKSALSVTFVTVQEWQAFLVKFGMYVKRERVDKVTLLATLKDMTDRIVAIENKTPVPLGATAAGGSAPFDPFASSPPLSFNQSSSPNQMLEQRVDAIGLRLKAAEADILTRSSAVTNDTKVSFGSLNVRTVQDTEAWLTLNPSGLNFGSFLDVFSFAQLVGALMHGNKDAHKVMQTVNKLGLASPREADAIFALTYPVPPLFTDCGQGMYGEKESAFSKFPTFSSFKLQSDRLSRAITTVGTGMNNHIDMTVLSGSPMHGLLKLAVSLSGAFLEKYIAWLVKSTEESLRAGLGEGPSWCLSTRLGECVFRTLMK